MPDRRLVVVVSTLLVAGGGLGWLTSVAAINTDAASPAPEVAQATPPAAGPPPAAGGTDQTRQRRLFSPRASCIDHVARRAGYRAALRVRLELKADQMAKWQAYERAAEAVTTQELARCASLPTEMKERAQFTERLNRREEMAKNRRAAIEAVKPSLLAVYDSLSPEQKAVFDRPQFRGHRGSWRRFDRG